MTDTKQKTPMFKIGDFVEIQPQGTMAIVTDTEDPSADEPDKPRYECVLLATMPSAVPGPLGRPAGLYRGSQWRAKERDLRAAATIADHLFSMDKDVREVVTSGLARILVQQAFATMLERAEADMKAGEKMEQALARMKIKEAAAQGGLAENMAEHFAETKPREIGENGPKGNSEVYLVVLTDGDDRKTLGVFNNPKSAVRALEREAHGSKKFLTEDLTKYKEMQKKATAPWTAILESSRTVGVYLEVEAFEVKQ